MITLPLGAAGFGLVIALAFVATALVTHPLKSWLARNQFGKVVREDGPDHAAKAGTPTMGGIGLLLVLVSIGLLLATQVGGDRMPLLVLALVAFGVLGGLDDWAGLARKGQARELGVGWSARHMIAAQMLIALALAWGARGSAPAWTERLIEVAPWAPWHVWTPAAFVGQYGTFAWLVVGSLVIVATVNGVNLSDGLDGLAAGLVALAFAGFALVLGRVAGAAPEALFGAAVAAACVGFLVHNRHPASVFMGNTTSMALGGVLAVLALVTGFWPLLPVIGAVFVIEILSDVVQVGYFKYSGGTRLLRCAPIHHHFEMGGWPETRVVRRFWLAGFTAAALGVGLSLLGVG